jgi:hypothetical protein
MQITIGNWKLVVSLHKDIPALKLYLDKQLQELLDAGLTIRALKLYRATYPTASFQEAVDYIRSLRRTECKPQLPPSSSTTAQ